MPPVYLGETAVPEPVWTLGLRVEARLGYRATAEADILRGHLNGPTANIAVQFGW